MRLRESQQERPKYPYSEEAQAFKESVEPKSIKELKISHGSPPPKEFKVQNYIVMNVMKNTALKMLSGITCERNMEILSHKYCNTLLFSTCVTRILVDNRANLKDQLLPP